LDHETRKGYTYARQAPGNGIRSQRKGGSQADDNVELHDELCIERLESGKMIFKKNG
jgi:hypothetical protein